MRGASIARVAGLAALITLMAATMEPAARPKPDYRARYYVMPGYYAEGSPPTGPEATRVGWQPGQVTPTPCPWWEYTAVSWQPVPWCMHPVLEATFAVLDVTRTAGIADGSIYGLEYVWEGDSKTPTVTSYGTVPPHAAATWTALTGIEER